MISIGMRVKSPTGRTGFIEKMLDDGRAVMRADEGGISVFYHDSFIRIHDEKQPRNMKPSDQLSLF